MTTRLKTGRAVIGVRLVLARQYSRVAHLLHHVSLPFRRPFLFLANLFAELGVLLLRLGKLSLKTERYLLKLENARLKVVNGL